MKRLAYRTVLAWLMAANAMLLAYQAPSGHPLSRVLGAIGLGYVSIMVVAYAAGAAYHLGRGNACRFVHRRQRPSTGRPATATVVVEPPAAEQQHAEAIAAVAAEPMQSQGSFYDVWMQGIPTDGTPALRPLGPTPTSEEELSTWGPAGRPMGFAPTVTDASPELWTAPDEATFDAFVAQRSEARRARHAIPEGLPAALQEFDWEPAGSLR